MQPLQMAFGTGTLPSLIGTTCPAGASIMHRLYDFHLGSGDNGNVQVINNCKDSNRTQNFLYDSMNRISQAYTTGNSPLPTSWGETFGPVATNPGVQPTSPGIDPWGNLTNRSGVTGKTDTEPLNAAPASVKNQLNGFCNDAAGNLVLNATCPTGAFTPTYSYDIENRLTSTNGWTYVYDGNGERVKKCNSCGTSAGGTLYWPSSVADTVLETDLAGTRKYEYMFFNGQRIARRDGSNPPYYYFSDHLKSTSVMTNNTGATQDESDYFPYGGEIVLSNLTPQNYKFNAKERDSESGLDNFGLGRFMTPDWAARPTAVPYAVFGDPQSLNLYGYVRNDPVSRADPNGHYQVNASGCGGNNQAKCQKKYDKAANKFETRRQKDLNSKKANVRTAAAAYGARGEANGVHVGFADLSSQHINGSVDPTHSAPGGGASGIDIEVTIDFGRAGSAETQTHEGTHVADDQQFLNSWNPGLGGYTGTLTHGQTEFNAFKDGAEINHEHGFGPKDDQKIWNFLRNDPHYRDSIDVPVFDPSKFPAAVGQD